MKLRRCLEDRLDFDGNDDPNVFPIQIEKSGEAFGFCPAKATWDNEAVEAFRTAVLSYEMKLAWKAGGMNEQPKWWREIMGDFIPKYEQMKFLLRAQSILGKENNSSAKKSRPQKTGAQQWQTQKTSK